MSQDDKVLLAMVFAHPAGIFLKSDVKYPVEAIFDSPMAAHGCAKGSCLPRQAREVIATFDGRLLAHGALRLNHANAAQPHPRLLRIEIGDASGVGNGPLLAVFQPSVSFVYAVVRVMH